MSVRFLLIVLLASTVVGVQPTAAAEAVQLSADDYAIYRAVLHHHWLDEGRSPVIVQQETSDAAHSKSFDRTVTYLRKQLDASDPTILVSDDLLQSYERVRASRTLLDPKRLQVRNASVIPSPTIDWAVTDDPFGDPWGIVRLSRIGFSADARRALLSASGSCGPRCGSGYYVLLEKRHAKWRVLASVTAWVA